MARNIDRCTQLQINERTPKLRNLSFYDIRGGAHDLEIPSRPRFFYNAFFTANFHHCMFNRLEVIAMTNKQTNPQTDSVKNIHLAPLCYTGGK